TARGLSRHTLPKTNLKIFGTALTRKSKSLFVLCGPEAAPTPPSTTSCPQRELVLRLPTGWALSKTFMPRRSAKSSNQVVLILSFLCLFVAASAQQQKNDITY